MTQCQETVAFCLACGSLRDCNAGCTSYGYCARCLNWIANVGVGGPPPDPDLQQWNDWPVAGKVERGS